MCSCFASSTPLYLYPVGVSPPTPRRLDIDRCIITNYFLTLSRVRNIIRVSTNLVLLSIKYFLLSTNAVNVLMKI